MSRLQLRIGPRRGWWLRLERGSWERINFLLWLPREEALAAWAERLRRRGYRPPHRLWHRTDPLDSDLELLRPPWRVGFPGPWRRHLRLWRADRAAGAPWPREGVLWLGNVHRDWGLWDLRGWLGQPHPSGATARALADLLRDLEGNLRGLVLLERPAR